MESKTLESYLQNVEELEKYATGQTILDSCRDIKEKAMRSSSNVEQFIKKNLDNVLSIP